MRRIHSRVLVLVLAGFAFRNFLEFEHVRRLFDPVVVFRGLKGSSRRRMIIEMTYLHLASKVIGFIMPAIDTDE